MKSKICSNPKCLQPEKPLSEFYKNCKNKDGLRYYCKECCKIYKKEYKEKYPWLKTLQCIKQRCENPNNKYYKDYGLRGIKCNITEEELKILWFRDKAYNLEQPSIDREDNNGNYELSNCRFIEMDVNRVKDRYKIVLQYDLSGNFIKEFESIKEASNKLSIHQSTIVRCVQGINKTAGGYKWRHKP